MYVVLVVAARLFRVRVRICAHHYINNRVSAVDANNIYIYLVYTCMFRVASYDIAVVAF